MHIEKEHFSLKFCLKGALFFKILSKSAQMHALRDSSLELWTLGMEFWLRIRVTWLGKALGLEKRPVHTEKGTFL